MKGRVRVSLFEGGDDVVGIHGEGAIGKADSGKGVGGSVACFGGVRGDAEGFEMGFDLRVFEPVGGIREVFIIEDEAG